MNKINKIVGVNITQLRNLSGLTQSQLGEICGVEYGTVQRWEKGKTWPKPEHIEIIANTFKLSPSQIYEDKSSSNFTQNLPSIFQTLAKNSELIELLDRLPNNQDTSDLIEDIKGMIKFELNSQSDSDQSQEA